jgi:hypothetical protein
MMFYPGHFPPTYLMPGLHPAYSRVHSSFRQNEGHNHLTGLDLTNNNIAKFNEGVHNLQDSVQFNNKPPQTVQSEEIIDTFRTSTSRTIRTKTFYTKICSFLRFTTFPFIFSRRCVHN